MGYFDMIFIHKISKTKLLTKIQTIDKTKQNNNTKTKETSQKDYCTASLYILFSFNMSDV